MTRRALQRTQLAAAAVFCAAVLVLAVQLLTPSPIVVSLGERGTETTRLGHYFTYSDVTVLVVSALLSGASGTYLLLEGPLVRTGEPLETVSEPSDEQSTDRPTATGATAVGATASTGYRAATTATKRSSTATNGAGERPEAERHPSERSQRERWEERVETLRNNERTIYSLLVDADGELPQRELVTETEMSKATVSRTLDALEHKDLVERKRRGMGNVVHLL